MPEPQIVPAISTAQRLRMVIRGAVQGVGFRPFVFRLASDLGLSGWVSNTSAGVFLEVEGDPALLRKFQSRLEQEKPDIASIQSLESSFLDPLGFDSFEIRESSGGEKTVLVLPDIATCPACLADVFDPENRRYRYPFTNCTNCGPRFTIIEALPYDRCATTMKTFDMCPECEREYRDPANRRFHAQPNACPVCGPQLEFWDGQGKRIGKSQRSLQQAASAIRSGKVVAVKGLGGFHLMVDARNDDAVRALREKKHREEKPFAVMYPRLFAVRSDCELSEAEERLLFSPASPIVLLERKTYVRSGISKLVAPRNPYIGAMLPYTPLHYLLMDELDFPVVATSGNLSDEPICTDEHEAVSRLQGIADYFLVHDRPIVRHVDDSIVRIVAGRELVLRRARGFAPLPVSAKQALPPILAVGAHQKNTIAASLMEQVFVSQHIGDLQTQEAFGAFERVIESFKTLYEFTPEAVACDLHPNYMSSEFARGTGLPLIEVQHHYAHVLACMAENELDGPVLGISWDGSGFGPDGTVWGGEFLWVDEIGYERMAHLRTFTLPGSEKAVKEPRRSALGALHELYEDADVETSDLASVRAFSAAELKTVSGMITRKLNSPRTSSAGRLFDAVASLLEVRQLVRFEGQAAMELEALANEAATKDEYIVRTFEEAGSMVLDWGPMIVGIRKDLQRGTCSATIAMKFHNTLVAMMIAAAGYVYSDATAPHLASRKSGQTDKKVVLTGGCFQNRLLTELAVRRLGEAGYRVYWHQRIPPNDGGIAVGQIMAAARRMRGAAKE
jgi:hydrogenase maturation protein HypF